MKTIYLIGAGMGTRDTLTLESREALARSELILGAGRLLEALGELPGEKRALVRSDEIAEAVRQFSGSTVSVLLSGDPGFYSGAAALYSKLPDCRVVTLPGISSLNYFCARLQTTWQDAKLLSVHGRDCNVLGEVQSHRKIFLLTGGKLRGEDVCRLLTEGGYGDLTVSLGERLSYPEERIVTGRAEELMKEHFADLTVMLVENPSPIPVYPAAVGLPDGDFLRGAVPMTKEAVRTAVVSRLKLREDSLIWDVGAGTGSVSVTCALTARKGQVYAVEKDPAALELLKANREKFGVRNLHLVPGEAPAALPALPAPDCVFIGGSSGALEGIFQAALEKNPALRLVLTAVTLESLTLGTDCFRRYAPKNFEVTQLSAARAKELGRYHLMAGENPVWILSGEGEG